MAGDVIDFGEIGHDVGRLAAGRDHVVDAGGLGHVLPHHVHHDVHRLDAVQGGATLVGGGGSVGGHAPEAELGRDVGEGGSVVGPVVVGGMPGQDRVHAVEEALPQHVDLAGAALLGRRAEDAERARSSFGRQPLFHGDGGGDGGGAEEMVAAAVARGALHHRLALGHGRLGESRQRVELGEQGHDRPALSPARHERGGDPGDSRADLEAGPLQLGLQQRAALFLLVSHFGEAPDLPGDLRERPPPLVEDLVQAGARIPLAARRRNRGDE